MKPLYEMHFWPPLWGMIYFGAARSFELWWRRVEPWNLQNLLQFDGQFSWLTGRLQFGNEVSQKPVMPISCHEVSRKKRTYMQWPLSALLSRLHAPLIRIGMEGEWGIMRCLILQGCYRAMWADYQVVSCCFSLLFDLFVCFWNADDLRRPWCSYEQLVILLLYTVVLQKDHSCDNSGGMWQMIELATWCVRLSSFILFLLLLLFLVAPCSCHEYCLSKRPIGVHHVYATLAWNIKPTCILIQQE